jgi:hypothetical protein
MTSTLDTDVDRVVKARHRGLWATGDYPAVATELIPTLGTALVPAAGVRAGYRVLDVGAGSGNTAFPLRSAPPSLPRTGHPNCSPPADAPPPSGASSYARRRSPLPNPARPPWLDRRC